MSYPGRGLPKVAEKVVEKRFQNLQYRESELSASPPIDMEVGFWQPFASMGAGEHQETDMALRSSRGVLDGLRQVSSSLDGDFTPPVFRFGLIWSSMLGFSSLSHSDFV